jgi:hypothetical protein
MDEEIELPKEAIAAAEAVEIDPHAQKKIERALKKLERRANRGPGFSTYAKRRLQELKQIQEELARIITESVKTEDAEQA